MSASEKVAKTSTKFFGLEDFLDIVLEVEDSEDGDSEPVRYACHKLELAKASKRFGEMLRKQELMVDEDGVKFIQIKDVDAKTLDKMLRHIYGDKIAETELLDAKLLEAAQLFKMDTLFRICLAATIPKEFTNENVLEALKIAYQLDLPDEKKSAFHFLWENLEELAETKEFKQLLVSNPGLMTDFMVKSKRFMLNIQDGAGFEMEKKLLPFTTNGPDDLKGNPVLVGTIMSQAGIQEFQLPDDLPMEAKGVRIIPVQVLQAGLAACANAFVKMWSRCNGVKCMHFLCRNRYTFFSA